MRMKFLLAGAIFAVFFCGCTLSGESSSRFAVQPEDVQASDGDGVFFSVQIKGQVDGAADENTYVWYKDEMALDPDVYGSGPTLRYVCGYSDSGSIFKVTVSNGDWSETSRSARLLVKPRAPWITDMSPYDSSATLPIPFWMLSTDTLRAGSVYKLRASVVGTGLTYRWLHKGVWTEYNDSMLYALPRLRKSDSGQVVTLVISNAFGSDTATFPLNVFYPVWDRRPIYMASQKSSEYGSLVDLDVPKTAPGENPIYALFPGTTTTANQEKLDWVVGLQYRDALFNEDYMLLSPRKAKKKGITSTSALDTARLADTKMVIIPRGTGVLTQEQAWRLYDQGVKRDSVIFHQYGRYGDVYDSWLLVKTDAGRLVILTSDVFQSGNGGSPGYWYLAYLLQGSIPD